MKTAICRNEEIRTSDNYRAILAASISLVSQDNEEEQDHEEEQDNEEEPDEEEMDIDPGESTSQEGHTMDSTVTQ